MDGNSSSNTGSKSIYATESNRHGFRIRDYIRDYDRDYTKVREERQCPCPLLRLIFTVLHMSIRCLDS